jgi:hypothetical protein
MTGHLRSRQRLIGFLEQVGRARVYVGVGTSSSSLIGAERPEAHDVRDGGGVL